MKSNQMKIGAIMIRSEVGRNVVLNRASMKNAYNLFKNYNILGEVVDAIE